MYVHIPALGIESSLRKNLETERDYERLFKNYASKTLPDKNTELERIKELVSAHGRVALTCFEANPSSCHRHKITERLQLSGDWETAIRHIL